MTTLRYTVSALVLLLALISCSDRKGGTSGDTPELGELLYDSQKYGIESAVIKYRITGYETGTEELAFDKFGMRQARTVHTQRKHDIDRHVLEIFSGKTFYRIDLDDKWGFETDRIELANIRALNRPLTPEDWTNITLELEGYEPTGTTRLLGRECAVWKHPQVGAERWVWNGIVLRTETRDGAGFVSEAQSIDEDPDFPADRFEVPDGIRME